MRCLRDDQAIRDAIEMGLFLRRNAQASLRTYNRLFPEWTGKESSGLDRYRFDMRDAMRCIQRAKYWRRLNG